MEYQYQIKLLGPIANQRDSGIVERTQPTGWVDVDREAFMVAASNAGVLPDPSGECHFFSGNNIEGRTVAKGQTTDG